jgi:hypothetical protein
MAVLWQDQNPVAVSLMLSVVAIVKRAVLDMKVQYLRLRAEVPPFR